MMVLRPKKRKVDSVKQEADSSKNLSDGESKEEISESENENDSDSWFEQKSTVKGSQSKKMSPENTDVDKPDEFISEYEIIRLANIAERNEMLRSMGIFVQTEKSFTSTPIKKETKRVKNEKENIPTRTSLRLRGKSFEKSDVYRDETVEIKEEVPELDTRNLGCERWKEDELEGRETFLEELKDKLKDTSFIPDSLDLTSCKQECFRDVMLSLVVGSVTKVVASRIQSICVHPSTSKRIVFVGSKSGSLGIWDVDGPDELSCFELYPNQRPINCITVDEYNPNEVYITSHDGTLICADINTTQFVNLYATAYEDRISHLTWHHQVDPNVFLVAHGDGSVLVVDKREKAVSSVINCFGRSCRTVQLHPTNGNYFLASSGGNGNGAGIFDRRNKKEFCHMKFSKGLTGAFFSHTGSNIVATCNDDTVQVWNSTDLNKVKIKASTPHNNHTGRWLSVFKAQWYPGRDDVFHIGSLMQPRRIQMYTSGAKLLTELRSEDLMVTVQSVIAAHNTLPFIVGGNSSGKVHAFIPPTA